MQALPELLLPCRALPARFAVGQGNRGRCGPHIPEKGEPKKAPPRQVRRRAVQRYRPSEYLALRCLLLLGAGATASRPMFQLRYEPGGDCRCSKKLLNKCWWLVSNRGTLCASHPTRPSSPPRRIDSLCASVLPPLRWQGQAPSLLPAQQRILVCETGIEDLVHRLGTRATLVQMHMRTPTRGSPATAGHQALIRSTCQISRVPFFFFFVSAASLDLPSLVYDCCFSIVPCFSPSSWHGFASAHQINSTNNAYPYIAEP